MSLTDRALRQLGVSMERQEASWVVNDGRHKMNLIVIQTMPALGVITTLLVLVQGLSMPTDRSSASADGSPRVIVIPSKGVGH